MKRAELHESDTREQAMLIKRSSQKFLLLVNQLLELTTVEFEPLTQDQYRGDLTDFMVVIADRFRGRTHHQHIRLNLDSQLPVADYLFDRNKLDSIITYLLFDVIRTTPKRGHIQLSLVPGENSEGVSGTRITLQCRGSGLTPEVLTPFGQTYNSSAVFSFPDEGQEVRLAVVQRLVAYMEGTLAVCREVDGGMQVILFLPLQPIDSSIPQKAPAAQPSSNETQIDSDPCKTAAAERPVIQVISGHPDLITFLRAELSPNYQVWTARDGEEGIAQVLEHSPDLIICEVTLREKDGLEVCEILKGHARTRHLPVVLLADQTSLKSRLEGLRKGADVYLTKPFSVEELTLNVRQLLANRKLWEEKTLQKSANVKDDASGAPDQPLIDQLHAFVEKELDNEQLEVEDLVRESGMSRSQLYRKVKAATNLSLGGFIRDHRLLRAMELLRTGGYNVTEVTYLTGFSNRHHFYRSFVAKYKQAPSEIRKK